jgi:hypothetical protein
MNGTKATVTWAGLVGLAVPMLALILSIALIGERRLHAYENRVSRLEAHFEHVEKALSTLRDDHREFHVSIEETQRILVRLETQFLTEE